MRVALTGGVGAGKSSLAAALTGFGAHGIDADAIAREVVAPGSAGLDSVVARFGPGVLRADGTLDRAALAELVFADPLARADLNAIVHPLVHRRSRDLMAAAPAGSVVVYEIPLLAETGRGSEFDVVVTVEADVNVRLRRLAARGMNEAAARARMAAQADDAQRRAIADEVIANDGDAAELLGRAGRLWARLVARAPVHPV